MAQRQTGRIIIAAVIAVVGVAVAWRSLHRTAPISTTQSIPSPTPPKEVTKKSAYEIRATPDTVQQAAAQIADVIRHAPASIAAEAGVTQVQMEALADRVTVRLRLVLSGADLSEVVAEARKDGMDWSEPDPDYLQKTRVRDESWASLWVDAPMSLDRAFIRVANSGARGEDRTYTMPRPWQHMSSRNLLRPQLTNFPENAQIAELVVPALTRAYGSSATPNIPVDIGFSYYWSSDKQRWIGANVTTYYALKDQHSVIPPP